MRQKGFATIFGLCLILIIALCVKGIQDAEANHAREVVNFETEQSLQLAAESAIVEAIDYVLENPLPYVEKDPTVKVEIPVANPDDDITVEVWGERGKIYSYPENKYEINAMHFNNGIYPVKLGVYFMATATIDGGFFGEKIYRRAYAYIVDGDATIYFMELPTSSRNYVVKKK